MRNSSHVNHYCRSADHTNVHWNWAALPKFNSAGIANDIQQWHYRHVELRNYQHGHSRASYLYIYAIRRTMRNHCNINCYDQSADHTGVYCYWTAMPKQYGTCIACNIE